MSEHTSADVTPWLCAMILDGKFKHGRGVGNGIRGARISVFVPGTAGAHLNEYLRRRPPNNGKGCEELVLNGQDL